jgi:DNA-binding LytR/AlgR family response regulator
MNDSGRLSCMVVDDEPLALSLIGDYVSKVPGLFLAYTISDPLQALEIVKRETIDLIFLDIQMPELNGIQFLKILQKKSMVIITTAYSEYALDGYEHHVIDYLLKPVTLERLMISADRAFERYRALQREEKPLVQSNPDVQHIFVKTEYRIVKVDLNEIYYLEGARDYVLIHLADEKILTLQSMKSIEKDLPERQFIRVHKSFIIAINKIAFIERGRVSIKKAMIPVSDTYRENFLKRLRI